MTSSLRPTQVVWSPKGVGNANFRDSEALLFGAVPLVDETSVACMSELYTAQNQVEGGTKHVPPCIRIPGELVKLSSTDSISMHGTLSLTAAKQKGAKQGGIKDMISAAIRSTNSTAGHPHGRPRARGRPKFAPDNPFLRQGRKPSYHSSPTGEGASRSFSVGGTSEGMGGATEGPSSTKVGTSRRLGGLMNAVFVPSIDVTPEWLAEQLGTLRAQEGEGVYVAIHPCMRKERGGVSPTLDPTTRPPAHLPTRQLP